MTSTAYGAKQFVSVKTLSGTSTQGKDFGQDEEIRLGYVAVTRARHHVRVVGAEAAVRAAVAAGAQRATGLRLRLAAPAE